MIETLSIALISICLAASCINLLWIKRCTTCVLKSPIGLIGITICAFTLWRFFMHSDITVAAWHDVIDSLFILSMIVGNAFCANYNIIIMNLNRRNENISTWNSVNRRRNK